MTPRRIQRKRTSGWKMPENTIYVGRPTEFGNPFKVGDYVKIGNGGNGLKLMRALNAQYLIADKERKALQQHLENQKAIQSALYANHVKKYQE